jgi:hypothetical protein
VVAFGPFISPRRLSKPAPAAAGVNASLPRHDIGPPQGTRDKAGSRAVALPVLRNFIIWMQRTQTQPSGNHRATIGQNVPSSDAPREQQSAQAYRKAYL